MWLEFFFISTYIISSICILLILINYIFFVLSLKHEESLIVENKFQTNRNIWIHFIENTNNNNQLLSKFKYLIHICQFLIVILVLISQTMIWFDSSGEGQMFTYNGL